jgi:hypothetical protein
MNLTGIDKLAPGWPIMRHGRHEAEEALWGLADRDAAR